MDLFEHGSVYRKDVATARQAWLPGWKGNGLHSMLARSIFSCLLF
jgi:hypothetical protein